MLYEGKIASQIRIKGTLWLKLKAIAASERRTANAQLECILEDYIRQYEATNGTIELPKDPNESN